VELDGSDRLVRLGQINGINVLGGFRTEAGFAIVNQAFSHTIVVRSKDSGTERSFSASVSGRASVSTTGNVVFDRRLDDGKFVIAHQSWNTPQTTLLTTGPTDMFPTLGPDGRQVVFVRVSEGAIISCQLNAGSSISDCKTVSRDPLGPRFTTLSPDGRRIAYQTTNSSASRLRIVAMDTGTMTDLGVYRSGCPPLWSSDTALWLRERPGAEWKEFDIVQGRHTGRLSPSRGGEKSWMCDQAPAAQDSSFPFEAWRQENRLTEIRVTNRF